MYKMAEVSYQMPFVMNAIYMLYCIGLHNLVHFYICLHERKRRDICTDSKGIPVVMRRLSRVLSRRHLNRVSYSQTRTITARQVDLDTSRPGLSPTYLGQISTWDNSLWTISTDIMNRRMYWCTRVKCEVMHNVGGVTKPRISIFWDFDFFLA